MPAARLFLLIALAGCSPAAIPSADPPRPPRSGADWPRFLGPNGDGSSPDAGIITHWPREGLRKVWECPLGLGYAPPTVAGGRLLQFDRHGDSARLTCREAGTGVELWRYEYPTAYEDYYGYDPGPRACPVVDGDRVYLHGVEGMLVCVNATNGKEIWKVDTRAKYRFHQNFFGVGSAPLVEGELLIVPVGGSPRGPRPVDLRRAKGNGSAIVAFDKRTGEVRYAFGDELASYSSPIIATVGDRRVGLYFARGGLLGFDPQAGKQLFHYPWRSRLEESANAANPVVVGDTVLISECYEKGSACLRLTSDGVTELWADEGKERGEQALMAHWCTPIAEGGYVYGCSGRHANEGDLRCIELATGKVQWIEPRTYRCTLTKIDGHLLSLAETGELRLIRINPKKYEEVARWQIPGLTYPCWAMPVVSRGLLYIRGKDETSRHGHRLVCFELISPK